MTYRQPFTSESVTEGHPDKVCDRISDTILDAIISEDPAARVAVETMATTGLIHVAGEVTTDAYVEIPHLVRETIQGIGYTSSEVGFDGASCGVTLYRTAVPRYRRGSEPVSRGTRECHNGSLRCAGCGRSGPHVRIRE